MSRLTLLGKIAVLKSLIASQLVYILSPLPTNNSAINKINSMLFNFLWDGKGDKIKRDIMISDYNNGGLRMIDIKLFNKALKSSWITKYLDSENHGKWKFLFDLVVRKFYEVTLVKKICQNTSNYRIPLFQKYYESGRTLNMKLTFTLLNS